MSIRSFAFKSIKTLSSYSFQKSKPHFRFHFFSSQSLANQDQPPLPDLVNEISRVLSDHRSPHHDLDLSLTPYTSKISSDLVEQVLKRCKNLGFSAHRFFLWAKRVPGFQHKPESYHIVIEILGSGKQFAILWDFMIEMSESKCFDLNPEVFWIIFRAYSKANLPGDAIRAFHRMVEFGIKPSITDFDHLLYVLCKRKHIKHAHEFFNRAKVVDFTPTAKTYSILIRGWGDTGESSEARKLFDEMLERKLDIDLLTFNSFLDALCKTGNVSEAYQMFQEMGKHGIEPDAYTYSIFVHAYCQADDIHSAFRVLDRMRRYNLIPNVYTYNHIIKRLCKCDKIDDAYLLLEEMIERGAKPDEWSYNTILAYHCDHCEVNRALKLISRMEKNNCDPDRHTYNMVLKLLIRIGRFDRATEVWEGMTKRRFYPSVSTFSVIVHGLCKKNGKLEEASKYFEMMIDEGIPPYYSTVELLRNRHVGLGLMDGVDVLADKMERSSSCSIREMASVMRGKRREQRSRRVETESESE